MTETTEDPVWSFVRALPPRHANQLHRTERLVALVHQAAGKGWTAADLAARCTAGTDGTHNISGVLMHRLAQCAETPPVAEVGPVRLPFCSPECRARAGWLEDDETGKPTGHCPCRTPATADV